MIRWKNLRYSPSRQESFSVEHDVQWDFHHPHTESALRVPWLLSSRNNLKMLKLFANDIISAVKM